MTVRRALFIAALACVAQALTLTTLALVTGRVGPLEIRATFQTDAAASTVTIATVLLAPALILLFAGAAATFGSKPRPWILAAGWSQGAGILTFLIARVNGIDQVTALVPLYAIAAGAVLLQEIDRDREQRVWRRPGAWAAVIGIVPWGVIAFAQVGAGFTVGGPGIGVRIATLLGLGTAAAGWWFGWKRRAVTVPAVVVMTLGMSATVWVLAASVAFAT